MAATVISPVLRWHDSGVVGPGPGIWYGGSAIDGAVGDWKRAPLGSIYVQITAGSTSGIYTKIANAGATSDWRQVAIQDASALIQSIIRPASDGATAVRVQNAAGTTTVLTVNTTSGEERIDALRLSMNGVPVTDGSIMLQPNGQNWTARTSAADNSWRGVTYGNGLFVAVAFSGTGNRVMTSPDGITWTARTSAADNDWRSVTYGNGLFVAVANSGTGNRVMTSPDGITWTARTSATDNDWYGVTYGNGLFVAVAGSGTGNRVMTSPDGITWTARTSAANNEWYGVTYGNGLFVAVAITGTGNRVMTSPDGVTWTARTSAANCAWYGVTYGNGLFVAVAGATSGVEVRVMTSPDGITWTARTAAAALVWLAIAYGNGIFVAVANSGTGARVMTNGKAINRDPLAVRSLTIDQNNATNATPVLALRQADVSEEFIRFIGTSTTDNSQSLIDAADLTTPGAIAGWIKVYVQDDAASGAIADGFYYLPFYAAPTA